MTERLSDVEARIGTVRQLSAVITAMRGIAASRSREARAKVDGIRAYAGTIANAIGEALVVLPEGDRPRRGGESRGGAHAVIALCAEQGFAGAFSARILDAARRLVDAAPARGAMMLLVGDRGLGVTAERGDQVEWSAPMAGHTGEVAALADRLADALYERIDGGHVARVSIVHALPAASPTLQIVERQLIPFDFDRFPPQRRGAAPLLTLSPEVLLRRLAEEYVFAELCEALMLSFAAENDARMRAMIAAHANVTDTLERLVGRSRQLRQEEITSEILELAGGTGAR